MRRREFVAFAAGAVGAACASGVRAQPKVPRIALLTHGQGVFFEARMREFREALKAAGYDEGRNVRVDWYRGDLRRDVTERLADEVVASRPDVIVAQSYGLLAAAARTRAIPIVCVYSGDLVDAGLVQSLGRPGGNVTGMQLMALELAGKRIELLRELRPALRRVAVLCDPGHAGESRERDVSLKAAERMGIQTSFHPARNFTEYDAALAAARGAGAEALAVFPDSVTNNRIELTAAFALRHRMASIGGWDNFAEAGLLMSYGPNLRASFARLAYFVDRILRGASPATLPAERPSVVELVINLRTAKALEIPFPQSLLLRADRVIE